MCETTTIHILEKDAEYLRKLKRKMRKNGLWSVVEAIVIMMKEHKLEGELR